MGWKAFAILATDQAGYFGSRPVHSASIAEDVRARLGLTDYESAGEEDFYAALHPRQGALYIGGYPGGTIICESALPSCFFDDRSRHAINGRSARFAEVKARLLQLYPDGEVMAIVLHSVVNLWGYSVYARGQLLRSAAGDSDNGLLANTGEPLPEEVRSLQECAIDKVDEEGDGEDLVFEVSVRMFGQRLDTFEELPLRLTTYRRKTSAPVAFVKRLFGRE